MDRVLQTGADSGEGRDLLNGFTREREETRIGPLRTMRIVAVLEATSFLALFVAT
jgi:hypothetical protein